MRGLWKQFPRTFSTPPHPIHPISWAYRIFHWNSLALRNSVRFHFWSSFKREKAIKRQRRLGEGEKVRGGKIVPTSKENFPFHSEHLLGDNELWKTRMSTSQVIWNAISCPKVSVTAFSECLCALFSKFSLSFWHFFCLNLTVRFLHRELCQCMLKSTLFWKEPGVPTQCDGISRKIGFSWNLPSDRVDLDYSSFQLQCNVGELLSFYFLSIQLNVNLSECQIDIWW